MVVIGKKRTMPSSLISEPKETKTPKITSLLLPRLVTPSDDDRAVRRLLVDEDAWCVGSCNGWLLLLDGEDATPFLVPASSSPTGLRRFDLPPIETLPCPPQVDKRYFVEVVRKSYIAKAVLVGNPETDNFAAVVLYNHSIYPRLAYCKKGDRSWKALPGTTTRFYHEIMVSGESLHALTMDLTVQAWDLVSGPEPVMTLEVKPLFPRAMWESEYSRFCFSKFDLAESSGEVLLLVRHVGDFVNSDGVAVEEGDLLTDEDTHPLVCPYRTLKFCVYKIDSDEENKWVRVWSLGDKALFVGCNNSVVLSAGGLVWFEKNSVYFTDDNWEQMNEDYSYGGHDLGKFNLEVGEVKPIDDSIFNPLDDRIDPPPFWIVPAN